MKKTMVLLTVLLLLFSLIGCSAIPEKPETDLEFWIAENVVRPYDVENDEIIR